MLKRSSKILVILGSLIAAACSNPVNRNSNPLQGYNSLNGDVPLNSPLRSAVQEVCGKPYALTVTTVADQGPNKGNEEDVTPPLQFSVGQTTIYHFYIDSNSLQPQLTLTGFPQETNLANNATFTQEKDGSWDLVWRPTSTDVDFNQSITLSLTDPSIQNCNAALIETLPVTVTTIDLKPAMALTGITNAIHNPNDEIDFQVEITDPTLQPGDTSPGNPTFSFPAKDSKGSYLKATGNNIVQCGQVQIENAPRMFREACHFNVNLVTSQNPTLNGLQSSLININFKSKSGQSVTEQQLIQIQLPDKKP